jgi:hypothetical protein
VPGRGVELAATLFGFMLVASISFPSASHAQSSLPCLCEVDIASDTYAAPNGGYYISGVNLILTTAYSRSQDPSQCGMKSLTFEGVTASITPDPVTGSGCIIDNSVYPSCAVNAPSASQLFPEGVATASVHCDNGCDGTAATNFCAPESKDAQYSINVVHDPPGLTLTTAPVDGSTIAAVPEYFGGTFKPIIPGKYTILSTLGSTTTTGGEWRIYPGSVVGVGYSTTVFLGLAVHDPVGNWLAYSADTTSDPGDGFLADNIGTTWYLTVDPTLKRSFYVDRTPPSIIIDPYASTDTFITGTAKDDVEVSHMYATVYFGNANLGEEQLFITQGATTRWTFQLPSIHEAGTYTVVVEADDEVENISTVTFSLTTPLVANRAMPITLTPHQSTNTVTFTPNVFYVPYNNTPVDVCGQLSSPDPNASFSVRSVNQYVTPFLLAPEAGCAVHIGIVVNANSCSPDDVIQVYDHTQLIGQIAGHVLIPTAENGTLAGVIYNKHLSDGTLYATNIHVYNVQFSGLKYGPDAPSLSLSGDTSSERLTSTPLLVNGVTYPYCVGGPPFPAPPAPIDSSNSTSDGFGFINQPGLSGSWGSIGCGFDTIQRYQIGSCLVPNYPRAISIEFQATVPAVNKSDVQVTRQEVNE